MWQVSDPLLAESMGISTNEEDQGDIYMIREASIFNGFKKNVKIADFDYESKLIAKQAESLENAAQTYAKILHNSFNSPIIVHDYMQFNMVLNKFKTAAVVVYCNKNDKAKFERIKEAMCEARRQQPLYMQSDKEGEKVDNKEDVLFIISTVKELMPVTKLSRDEPQALFVHPQDVTVNLLEEDKYLKSLQRLEGKTLAQFKEMSQDDNNPEFVPAASDDEMTANRKETKRLIFSPERFLMPKLHHTFNHGRELESASGIVEFTQKCLRGEMPNYFESEAIPK